MDGDLPLAALERRYQSLLARVDSRRRLDPVDARELDEVYRRERLRSVQAHGVNEDFLENPIIFPDREADASRVEPGSGGRPDEKDGVPSGAITDQLVASLGPVLARLRWNLPPHLVRAYPTEHVNALVLPTPDGALILVNDGLLMLMHKLGKLFWSDVIGFICYSAPRDYEVERSPPDDHEISILRLLFTAYCFPLETSRIGSRRPPRVPSLGGVNGLYHLTLLTNAERFVLGHEYGHLRAGHVDHAPRSAVALLDQSVLALRPTWEDEFVADELGVHLMVAAPPTWSRRFPLSRVLLTGAPRFFFATYRALVLIGAWRGVPALPETHPPVAERLARIESLLDVTGTVETACSPARVFERWLAEGVAAAMPLGPVPVQMTFEEELAARDERRTAGDEAR